MARSRYKSGQTRTGKRLNAFRFQEGQNGVSHSARGLQRSIETYYAAAMTQATRAIDRLDFEIRRLADRKAKLSPHRRDEGYTLNDFAEAAKLSVPTREEWEERIERGTAMTFLEQADYVRKAQDAWLATHAATRGASLGLAAT